MTPGKYLVAVSGGVDSVVLLDLLYYVLKDPKTNLIVAHYDHGIRPDSSKDRKFVEKLTQNYDLEFYWEEGKLGPDASEAEARRERYEFLERIKRQTGADGIITAHHQDDLVETIVINLLRGTGRKGLSSLASGPGVIRPLLNIPKSELITYAKKKGLKWQEDETNLDQKYLRNFVRHSLFKNLSKEQKHTLLKISRESMPRNKEIDELIDRLFLQENNISRDWFVSFSHDIASEIVAKWLRSQKIRLDKKTVNRLVIKLKTTREGKIIQANQSRYFIVRKGIIRMNTPGVV